MRPPQGPSRQPKSSRSHRRWGMKQHLAAIFLAGTFLCTYAFAASRGEEFIFTNVNVVDTRTGEILHNMTLVVRDGRIEAMAKIGLIGSGRHYHVINAAGKYLI